MTVSRIGAATSAILALVACRPTPNMPAEGGGTGGGGETSRETTSSGFATGSGEESSTTEVAECSEVFEGVAELSGVTDTSAFENVQRIEGSLRIRGWAGDSLEGLFPCLEEVTSGSLLVADTANLASLRGLEALRVVEGGVAFYRNAKLTSLEGLEGLEETGSMTVASNPVLADIDLPALRQLGHLDLGLCAFDSKTAQSGTNGLVSLGGFLSLESLGGVGVSGQADLVALPLLYRLVEKDAALGTLSIQHNPSLPVEEVDGLREFVDEPGFQSCNNLGESEENRCSCNPSG